MEVWDAYDSMFHKIEGVSLVRGEPIPDGYYHLVSEIIVRHKDGSYLMMQRDKQKRSGGMWEATAGGSALRGESSLDCAMRELKEETGIETNHLEEIGRVIHHGHKTLYVEYICHTDVDKDGVTLQKGETSAYRWVSADELRDLQLSSRRLPNFVEELCFPG